MVPPGPVPEALLNTPVPGPEIEAESVAYLVCGAKGIAADAYSFGYVASWSGGDTERIRATSARTPREPNVTSSSAMKPLSTWRSAS